MFDVEFARGHFPQLNNGWAFFENAGGSYVPQQVLEQVHAYMRELQIQPGGVWPNSQYAAERIMLGRERLAAMINARVEELIVGPSTTLNLYLLAQALKPNLQPGDEIIVTNQDHEANSGVWRRLHADGIVVREWRVNPESGELDIDALPALLNKKTRLVCFPHVSNIVGTINDVAKITRMAHAAGAQVCVDGVAYAPHRALDVKALNVDFYAFSLYKVYGPHLGVLYGKHAHLLGLANQNHYFLGEDQPAAKLNPGGQQHELAVALNGIADYLDALSQRHGAVPDWSSVQRVSHLFALIAEHETALVAPLLAFLRDRSGVRLLGQVNDAAQRVPTVSFCLKGGGDMRLLGQAMAQRRIAVGAGHFYACRVLQDLGISLQQGVMRISMVHYNSHTEVVALLRALDEIL